MTSASSGLLTVTITCKYMYTVSEILIQKIIIHNGIGIVGRGLDSLWYIPPPSLPPSFLSSLPPSFPLSLPLPPSSDHGVHCSACYHHYVGGGYNSSPYKKLVTTHGLILDQHTPLPPGDHTAEV